MSPETLSTSVPLRSQGTVRRFANCNAREIEANDAEELLGDEDLQGRTINVVLVESQGEDLMPYFRRGP